MENDSEVLKMTQEIIFHINQRKEETLSVCNRLIKWFQTAIRDDKPMIAIDKKDIRFLYNVIMNEAEKINTPQG